jgi:hypothetical protein
MSLYLPCPICQCIEGCDHSVSERRRAYADLERRAELYDHMLAVAQANGHASITEAIAGGAYRLDKPAKVGGARFCAGVSWRLVVEAAQRQYEYDVTPEKEAARIERAREWLAKWRNAPFAPIAVFPADTPVERADMLSGDDTAEFAQLQTFLTEHCADVRPNYPAGIAAWALAALVFARADAAQPDEIDAQPKLST